MSKIKDDSGKLKIQIKARLSTFSDPLKYKMVDDTEINLTVAKAYEFLELKEFQGERACRPAHVQFLTDELVNNRFLWQNVTLAVARIGKDQGSTTQWYRINGQHTAWMRVSIPDEVAKKLEPIKATCRQHSYEVENEEQLRNLYACFDRGAPRSVGHISKVLLLGTRSAQGISIGNVNKLVAGFRIFWAEDWNIANVNPNDLTGIIEKSHSTLFNTVGQFLDLHVMESKECRRAAVIGAMFATFSKHVDASNTFWSAVWGGLNLQDKLDARYKLREFIHGHGHKDAGANKISQEDLFRACVNTWNRWRDGEKVEAIRSTDKRPKVKA